MTDPVEIVLRYEPDTEHWTAESPQTPLKVWHPIPRMALSLIMHSLIRANLIPGAAVTWFDGATDDLQAAP